MASLFKWQLLGDFVKFLAIVLSYQFLANKQIKYFVVTVIIAITVIFGIINYPSSTDLELINSNMNKQSDTVDTSFGSPVMGSSDAPVTIIEFGDYQCSNCKKWFLETKPDIITNYIDTGKASLVFVDIAFLGKDSLPASRATYCAQDQGQYWKYHSFLYSNQMGIDNGWANNDSLKGYAYNLGLDMDLFETCIDSDKFEKRVEFNTKEAQRNKVTATPTF